MNLAERFHEYVPTRGIFANRSIVLDTKKCECTQTKRNPIFYDADKGINGLSYEGIPSLMIFDVQEASSSQQFPQSFF